MITAHTDKGKPYQFQGKYSIDKYWPRLWQDDDNCVLSGDFPYPIELSPGMLLYTYAL